MADDYSWSTSQQRQTILTIGLSFVDGFNALYQAVVIEGKSEGLRELLPATAPWRELKCFEGVTTAVCKAMVREKKEPLTPEGCARAGCPVWRGCYYYTPKYVVYSKAQHYMIANEQAENDEQFEVMCNNCDHAATCRKLTLSDRLVECLKEEKAALDVGVEELTAKI